ncbi:MAG: PQQ-like beta-propeller repeat protein [Candidatus Bathyarchaeum sp.]|nr:MAG: PQQ-like beta-propeller repeat protein [Candidatus Bathyarchaeum sp.]
MFCEKLKEKRKLKISTSKKTKLTAAIAIVLLITSTVLLMVTPLQAQIDPDLVQINPSVSGPLPSGATVDWTHDVEPRLSFSPNPIGVNQVLLVNYWVTPPPSQQRYMKDYRVVITDPNGDTDVVTQDSYVADGTAWFSWLVDIVGEWTLQFHFDGMYFPAGYWDDGNYSATEVPGWVYYEADYYNPKSTPVQTLTVQEEMVESWHRDLPTDYWDRPIHLENREWAEIGGNYPWDEYANGGAGGSEWSGQPDYYGPYIKAPNTSHIAWKKLDGLAGIIGGETGVYGRLDRPSMPNVIYMGRCYDTYYKPGVGNVAACYSLRTGEIFYEIPTADGGVTPTNIGYFKGTGASVPGGGETNTYNAILVAVDSAGDAEILYKINPETGAVSDYDIEGAGRIVAFHQGYFLSIRDSGNTAVRNWMEDNYWTETDITLKNGLPTFIYNWSILSNTNTFENRLVSNNTFTICPSYRGSAWPPNQRWRFYGRFGTPDLSSGVTCITRRFWDNQVWGGSALGVSLADGEVLWERFFTNAPYSPSTTVAEDGVFIICFNQGELVGLDMHTGEIKWTNTDNSYPYGGFWGYDEAAAYGMAYFWSYDGVQAFNLQTGETEWHYNDVAVPFETPYLGSTGAAAYSYNGYGMVADGKVYTENSEHTTTAPYPRGWSLHCIDAYTGEGIWKLAGQIRPGAASDGYLFGGSSYDGYLYCIGKGKSATTVTAPDVAVPKGTAITIKGTVLDMSPAQPGTPCVSADSMDTQMNYLHMQRPIDGHYHNETITGVPVMLTAVSEDGSYIDIGTTTTDGYYGTFSHAWTPPDEGTYKIIANFIGDDSYGSSGAATGVTVGPAPEEVDLTPVEGSVSNVEDSISALTTYVIVVLVLVIIALVIVVYLVLKRQ